MKLIKRTLSVVLALLIVLPVFIFAVVPTYITITDKPITFIAPTYSSEPSAPITVTEQEIDADEADPPTVETVTIASSPNKLIYNYGEAINFSGLMLSVEYSDGSFQTVTDTGAMILSADHAVKTEPNTDSTVQTVTISYESKIISFNITVNNPVSSISVESAPDITTYSYGNTILFTGLRIKTTRLDGSTAILIPTEMVDGVEKPVNGFSFSTINASYTVDEDWTNLYSDTARIKVFYKDKETFFEITVNNPISWLHIEELPQKLTYNYGEHLDTAGMIVNASHKNGTEEENVDYDCNVTTLTQIGGQKVTVSYAGKETTFTVDVLNPVIDLELLSTPYKTVYKTRENLNSEGMMLRARYLNGFTEILEHGYTIRGFNSSVQVFAQNITVSYSYDGNTDYVTFTVDIFAPSTLITGGVYELYYLQGISLSPSVPERDYQSSVTYGYWISDERIANITEGTINGLRRGTVDLRVTATEIIEKDGQTLTFNYSEYTTIRVMLMFWQWFIKYFVFFGWLGFDIYI